MNFKASVSAVLIFMMTLTGAAEASYDLPKIQIEKKISNKKTSVEKEKVLKSDWKDFSQFKEKIETALAENPNLSPSSSERIGNDKNLIFVAFYKNIAFFLDRYSIEVINDDDKFKVWEQHIFTVGEKISGKNSRVTVQKFRFENKKIFNSSKRKNVLDAVKDTEDKKFLEECFKVGYYYAFGEEVDLKN